MNSVLDRSQTPPASQARAFSFPGFEHQRLENGLSIFTGSMTRAPLVHLVFLAPAGAQFDPSGKAGLATYTAALLDEGTEEKTALEIAREVEHLGGSLATGGDWNTGYAGIGLLAHHLDAGLRLLAECVIAPSFPNDEIERLREQRLTEIRRRRDQPAALAEHYFYRALYEGTVYGNTLLGTEESLASIGREDFADFYSKHYTSHGSAILVVGDIDPDATRRKVEEAFADLRNVSPPKLPTIEPPTEDHIRVHIVDRPSAAQTELRLGHIGVPRLHPDRVPLHVLNALLGGTFTSRINMNLRERHGYTYGAQSRFVDRIGPGPFVVSTAVASEVTGAAVMEIRTELCRIQEQPVTQEELDETKNYLLGIFPYTLQTLNGFARRLEELAIYQLSEDYFSTYLKALQRVTREEILRVAQEHIRSHELAVVAVGPAAELRPQLEAVGRVEVFSLET